MLPCGSDVERRDRLAEAAIQAFARNEIATHPQQMGAFGESAYIDFDHVLYLRIRLRSQ